MRRSILGCSVALALTGVVLGPLPGASAAVVPAKAAHGASVLSDPPPPDPFAEHEMKRQAQGFRTFGKMGSAYADTSTFAGDVLGGETDPVKIEIGLKKVDTSLDNLLAIIPGGPLGSRSGNPVLSGTIESIKSEVRKLSAARVKNDYPAIIGSGAALTTQLSLLSAECFATFGVNLAQQIVETVLQVPPPAPKPEHGA
ncbi:hypothetical protein [Streptomyces sp. NBC_01465]|uniref:hypothetical protein n=1 Tax=Streptomyces sp. NBC_01465 TaxID=2903878 RepID=UPI002E378668|nr:hypothetical protein [Streptomyces sp. NBC_01465]